MSTEWSALPITMEKIVTLYVDPGMTNLAITLVIKKATKFALMDGKRTLIIQKETTVPKLSAAQDAMEKTDFVIVLESASVEKVGKVPIAMNV